MNVDQSSNVCGNDANSVVVPKNGIEEGVGRSAAPGNRPGMMFGSAETAPNGVTFDDSSDNPAVEIVPFQVFSYCLNLAYADVSSISSNLAMTLSKPSIKVISV